MSKWFTSKWFMLCIALALGLLNAFLGVRYLSGAEAAGTVVLGTFNLGVAVFLAIVIGRMLSMWRDI